MNGITFWSSNAAGWKISEMAETPGHFWQPTNKAVVVKVDIANNNIRQY